MTNTSTIHQKLIGFPEPLYKLASKQVKKFGISFSEYLRMLVIQDVLNKNNQIEMVDEDTEKRIGESVEDFKHGRYTVIKGHEELEKYFNKLS
jgi:hypothetical protein